MLVSEYAMAAPAPLWLPTGTYQSSDIVASFDTSALRLLFLVSMTLETYRDDQLFEPKVRLVGRSDGVKMFLSHPPEVCGAFKALQTEVPFEPVKRVHLVRWPDGALSLSPVRSDGEIISYQIPWPLHGNHEEVPRGDHL
jgi:hypothetical protein